MLAADASLQPLGALADRGHFSDAQTTLAAAAAVYSRCARTTAGSAERCSKAAAIATLLKTLQQHCVTSVDSKERSDALAAAKRTVVAIDSMPPASLQAPLCPLLLGSTVSTTTTTATATSTANTSGASTTVVAAAVPVLVAVSTKTDAAVMLPITTKAKVAGGDAPTANSTADSTEKQQQFARQFLKQHSTVAPDDDDTPAGTDYAFDYDNDDSTTATTAATTAGTAANTSNSQDADAAAGAVAAVAAACVTAALRSAVAVATVRIVLRKGSRVTSRYRGGVSEYAGTVQRVHLNGTYDVHYDDGEGELRCAAKHLRLLETATAGDVDKSTQEAQEPATAVATAVAAAAAGAVVYSKGSRVSVQGRFNSWPGTVLCSSSGCDDTYDINYDDGERELSVAAELIRLTDSSSSNTATALQLREGDKIEARYKGRERWYAGVIRRVNRDDTYDINYDDGERELSVAADLIRLAGSASSSSRAATVLREGDKIEARYKGRERWYAGVIRRVNRDDTYDIDYDDGERELSVAAELVRLIGSTSSSSKRDKAAVVFREGDKIEARYRGRERWFAGTVQRTNRAAYDIENDDGVVEPRVPAHLLTAAASSTNSTGASGSGSSVLCVGDRIEARYKGRDRYYPGTITAVNASTDTTAAAVTYDITYDDDEQESSVAAQLVRREVPAVTAATALTGTVEASADSCTDDVDGEVTTATVHDGKASAAAAGSSSSLRVVEQQRSQGVDSGG
jgi:hypothetical protein